MGKKSKVFAQAFFKKLAGCRAQFAGGKRPAPTEPAGETRALRPCPYGRAARVRKLGKQRSVFPGRWHFALSALLWRAPPPKGEARLGSPFGRAVAARRLRGQLASASTQPMRGGRWQLALSVLANASPPPPKGEARLGSPLGGAVAVRRLRGPPASASTQPMRGSRWHLALSVLANASPPPPRGEARLGSPFGGRYVPVGRCPAAVRGGSRDAGTAAAVTERATCQRFHTAHARSRWHR